MASPLKRTHENPVLPLEESTPLKKQAISSRRNWNDFYVEDWTEFYERHQAKLRPYLPQELSDQILQWLHAHEIRLQEERGMFFRANTDLARSLYVSKELDIFVCLNRKTQGDPTLSKECCFKVPTTAVHLNTGFVFARLVTDYEKDHKLGKDKVQELSYREAFFLEKFRNTPGIVKTYDVHYYKNKQAIIQQLGEMDLCIAIENNLLTPKDKIQVTQNILTGLFHVHEANVIHRDLKPENIYLYRDPETKIMRGMIGDFGLAGSLNDIDAMNEGLGTKDYLPPERESIEKLNKKSRDIWAMGRVLKHLHSTEKPLDPKTAIGKLIIQMMDQDPEKRPSAAEVLETVNGLKS